MAENTSSTGAGGFLQPSLPSPAPTSTSTRSALDLPHPRGHALSPGSAKEDKVRRYVEERLLHISRRYIKKFGLQEPTDPIMGYGSITELCKDLEALINIIWLSGTPSLQVPYLLNIAGEFNTWVKSFPPSPVAIFSVLRKLDHCFASLLSGEDIETKEALPGFGNSPRDGMSRTDMVRCKSTVEQTRVIIVDVMNNEADLDAEEEENTDTAETGDEFETSGDDRASRVYVSDWQEEDDERLHMDVARVYENTLVHLGEKLGDGAGVGVIQVSYD